MKHVSILCLLPSVLLALSRCSGAHDEPVVGIWKSSVTDVGVEPWGRIYSIYEFRSDGFVKRSAYRVNEVESFMETVVRYRVNDNAIEFNRMPGDAPLVEHPEVWRFRIVGDTLHYETDGREQSPLTRVRT